MLAEAVRRERAELTATPTNRQAVEALLERISRNRMRLTLMGHRSSKWFARTAIDERNLDGGCRC